MGKGGSKSSSKSGYAALSKPLKAAFDPFGGAINQYTLPGNPGVNEMFTPMGVTSDENRGLGMLRQGFTPDEASLRSDIAMQMNPYMDSVIAEVNRQGSGDYSILKQALSEAGQSNSNRTLLGANDIDLSRMNQIGGLLGNQFNTSLDNAMTTLPQLRAMDAQGLMNTGGFLRGLDTQTRQAPYNALQAGVGLMAPFMGGSTSTQKQTPDTLGTIGNVAMSAAMLFSDRRLKENLREVGEENGHKLYEFNYIGENEKYIGVMADEVKEKNPEAIHNVDGYMMVDYRKIGVNFREA